VVSQFGLNVAREVENAGRRQIVKAVESDEPVAQLVQEFEIRQQLIVIENRRKRKPPPVPKPLEFPKPVEVLKPPEVQIPERKSGLKLAIDNTRPVQGWARIATGRETCAWCLMLVSRGPVYKSAQTAGSVYDDETTMAALAKDAEVNEFMNDWHVGCDCKVVPVFDKSNWPGMDAQNKAMGLWVTAGLRADKELEEKPDKQYYSFKQKRWLPTDVNRETINQLRQMIEAGEISSADWAVLNIAA
jgi:hypothetical protein